MFNMFMMGSELQLSVSLLESTTQKGALLLQISTGYFNIGLCSKVS